MTILAEPTQTRPIVIGGIYKYNTTWGAVGRFVVEGIHNEFIHGWILDSNNNNTGVHVTYTDERIDAQIGYDITYSPAYQALQERLEYLKTMVKNQKAIAEYCDAYQLPTRFTLELIHSHISASILKTLNAIDTLTKNSSTTIDPISTGLSPLWNADRCEIPVDDKIKWVGFTGRKINVMGFAQNCLITTIFHKYGDEWAEIFHERYGFLYRKTKSLMVKDLC